MSTKVATSRAKNQAVAVVMIVMILSAFVLYLLWPRAGAETGLEIDGEFGIIYADGTRAVVSTESSPLERISEQFNLAIMNIGGRDLTMNDRMYLSTSARFTVIPRDKPANVQYWMHQWIQLEGKYARGARLYSPLSGFEDGFYLSWGCKGDDQRCTTSRWNGIDIFGTSGFIPTYYKERGSGLQAGNLNLGAEYAKDVTNAFKGVPVAESLAKALTTLLAKQEISDGYRLGLNNWNKPAYEVYIDLQRINWKGLSFNAGSFSVGLGDWARFDVGDTYKMNIYAGWFWRFQDITGEWSDWKAGSKKIGTITFKIVEGTWRTVDMDVYGGASSFRG